MSDFADFELGLIWDREQGSFDVNLRFMRADSVDWPAHPKAPLSIDLDRLSQLSNDLPAYGTALTEMVFGPEEVARFYDKAIAAARTMPVHLRIHMECPRRFHSIRWELLRDPVNGSVIATNRNILFSRYLSNANWQPISASASRESRALAVIAAPSNLHEYAPRGRRLPPIAVDEEIERAQDALRAYRPLVLAGAGKAKATLADLLENLERLDNGFDILYLVSHGALTPDDVPLLYLEQPDGTADPVDGRRLAEHIQDLDRKPTLVVLLSCQSADAGSDPQSGDEGALAGLGPRLAGAGVAAVVGMQGNVTMETVKRFVPSFFAAFHEDGVVDRAMAVARGAVRDRPDWWVPVLFSRLRSGQMPHAPKSTERAGDTWEDVTLMVRNHRFTPVLGPGLADAIFGSRPEIARRWARRWQMPIASHARSNLAQVAQYLRVGHTQGRVTDYFQDYIRTELRERKENAKGDDPFRELSVDLIEGEEPERAVLEVGRLLRDQDPTHPYRALASMPVKVFVTTAWTDLLQDAMRHRDPPKRPVTLSFPWTNRCDWDEPAEFDEPTVECPWVYHLFGRLHNLDSLVLTEDDYLEWLTAWIEKQSTIPPAVKASLTKNSLLFLGYSLDDWDFRVIFQSIKSFRGSMRSRSHIGVQLRPETEIIEAEAAQNYLESFFGEDKVNIFWAETGRFLDELRERTGIAP
jgi:SIR2-like domain/CHAT domain